MTLVEGEQICAEVKGTHDGYCVRGGLGWCEQDGLCGEQPGPLKGGG